MNDLDETRPCDRGDCRECSQCSQEEYRDGLAVACSWLAPLAVSVWLVIGYYVGKWLL